MSGNWFTFSPQVMEAVIKSYIVLLIYFTISLLFSHVECAHECMTMFYALFCSFMNACVCLCVVQREKKREGATKKKEQTFRKFSVKQAQSFMLGLLHISFSF